MPKLSAQAPFLHSGAQVSGSTFGAYCEVGQGSRIHNSRFDDYAYCDQYADIANTTVGKFANIAAFARIGPTDHPYRQASLHHFHYRSSYYWEDAEDDADFFEHRASRRAVIGHDTWIGHGAIIRPEVTVGHGAIVASAAVVTKDVPPYTIVGGVTAQEIKPRFDAAIAARLLDLAWWDWDHATLRARLADFRHLPIEGFLEKYERS